MRAPHFKYPRYGRLFHHAAFFCNATVKFTCSALAPILENLQAKTQHIV